MQYDKKIDISKITEYDNHVPDLWKKPYIDKDEGLIDFYICWKEFGLRPSKVGLYSEFNRDKLWDIIDEHFNIDDQSINKVSEIVPDDNGFILNTKYSIRVNSDLYMSFIEFDNIPSEEAYCSSLIFYYNHINLNIDMINDILELFQSSIEILNDMEVDGDNLFSLMLNDENELGLLPISIEEKSWEEVESFYNKSIITKGKKIVNKINNKKKGLHILSGERGCGKTTFIKPLIREIDKNIIYIPLTMIENSFNNIDFNSFLDIYGECVIIVDDCENYFNKIHQRSNIYVSNVLQQLDSLQSKNIHIILSMNITIDLVDENLLNCNNLKSIIKFDKMSNKKARKLSKKLGFNKKYLHSTSLSEVMNDKESDGGSKYL